MLKQIASNRFANPLNLECLRNCGHGSVTQLSPRATKTIRCFFSRPVLKNSDSCNLTFNQSSCKVEKVASAQTKQVPRVDRMLPTGAWYGLQTLSRHIVLVTHVSVIFTGFSSDFPRFHDFDPLLTRLSSSSYDIQYQQHQKKSISLFSYQLKKLKSYFVQTAILNNQRAYVTSGRGKISAAFFEKRHCMVLEETSWCKCTIGGNST